MARRRRFSADRLTAAVAANRSVQRVSLYGPPFEEVVAGLLKVVPENVDAAEGEGQGAGDE
jgi:hypothetical protein